MFACPGEYATCLGHHFRADAVAGDEEDVFHRLQIAG
jgi:hypothetical protein